MADAVWLADVLRADGLTVIELDGWRTRGGDFTPEAVICHHTATGPGWSDESVVRLLRDGRSDLPGPLSQLGLRRDGRYDLIAAGRANHNGASTAKYGNDSIGIEAYNDGVGEPWPAVQLDAFERGAAAILRHLDLPVSRCLGHKESDPTRKIDPRDIDMNAFRSKVARHVIAPTQEDDMPLNDDDKKWLRALATEIAGNAERVENWDHHYGQTGTRRTAVRWLGEVTETVRDLKASEIASAVAAALSGVGTSGMSSDDVYAAAKRAVGDLLAEKFGDG